MNISPDKDVEVVADLAAAVVPVEMKIPCCYPTEQIQEIIKPCIFHILICLITPNIRNVMGFLLCNLHETWVVISAAEVHSLVGIQDYEASASEADVKMVAWKVALAAAVKVVVKTD